MKKFLSLVLASALLTSSLGMVAFAEEPDLQIEYVSADITVELGSNGEYEDTTDESP